MSLRAPEIVVRNWSRFQHYKTRNPPWIRLYRDLLDSSEYRSLSDSAARLLMEIWLLASELAPGGRVPFDLNLIAWRTGRSSTDPTLLPSLQELAASGFIHLPGTASTDASASASTSTPQSTETEYRIQTPPEGSPPSPALQELEEFLGEGALVAELVATGDNPDLLARGFLGLYGPEGTEELLRKRAGTRWPTVVRKAVQRFVAEGHEYNGRFFRRFVKAALDEADEDHAPRSPSFGDETERDRARAEAARTRHAQRNREEVEAEARSIAAEAEAAEAWFKRLRGDELDDVRDDVEGRIQTLAMAGARRSPLLERATLVEVFKSRRPGRNGSRPMPAEAGAAP